MAYRSKPKVDLTGKRFGLLTIVEQVDNVEITANDRRGQTAWLCYCRCGSETVVSGPKLKSGNTSSCGCLHRRQLAERSTTHGLGGHPLYNSWDCLVRRCLDPDHKDFPSYGRRKIGIHPAWRDDNIGCDPAYQTGDRSGLARFIEWIESSLGPRPEGHSLDRINNDGNYEPGNVRWADATTQRANQRPRDREAEQRFIFGY